MVRVEAEVLAYAQTSQGVETSIGSFRTFSTKAWQVSSRRIRATDRDWACIFAKCH